MIGMVNDAEVPAFGPAEARKWAGGPLDWWVPAGVLSLGWAAALLLSLGPQADCSATDPAACGPDLPLALATVIMVATPVLLWWILRLGCLAGIVHGGLVLLFVDDPAAHLAWSVFAVGCLVMLALLVRDADRQHRITAPERLPGLPTGSIGEDVTRRLPLGLSPPRLGWRSQVATLLILGFFAAVGLHSHLVAIEDRHLAAAQRVNATVTGVDLDRSMLTLRIPGVGIRELGTKDTDRVVGAEEPVLVDPGAGDWVRLVAEPADQTYVLTIGLLALLLALLLGFRDVAGTRWPASVKGRELPARRVLVDSDGTTTYLYPVGAGPGEPPFAVLSTEPDPYRPYPPAPPKQPVTTEPALDAGEQFGRIWRGEESTPAPPIEPGLVLGDLRTGSWTAVLVGNTVLFPRSPLGRAREVPRWWTDLRGDRPGPASLGSRPRARTAVEEELPGQPVTAAGPMPADLPQELRPDRQARLYGWLLLAAGLLIAPLSMPAADHLDRGWVPTTVVALSFTFGPVLSGWSRITQRLRLEPDALVIIAAFQVHRVPWSQVHGVRLKDDGVLALAWTPEETFQTAPLSGAGEAAATILALRDHAIALEDDEAASHQFRWSTGILLVTLTLAIGAGWVSTL